MIITFDLKDLYIRLTEIEKNVRSFSPKFKDLFLKSDYLFKVLSVASHYFFPSFWQFSDTTSKKKMRLLSRSTNRSIFWLLYKSGNTNELGRMPLMETNGSRKEQCLESTGGGVRPTISAFPSMSWPVLRYFLVISIFIIGFDY